MIATRHGNTAVKKGDKLAGTRVIPLVIGEEKLQAAEAAARMERRYLEQWNRVEVLFEEEKDGLWWGHTTRYCRVGVRSADNLHNQLRTVEVTGVEGSALLGTLAPDEKL